LSELEAAQDSPDFWNDQNAAKSTLQEVKRLKLILDPWAQLAKDVAETSELVEMTRADDPSGNSADALSLQATTDELVKRHSELEFRLMLSGEMDVNNTYLQIHAGAGGTESCDWASMLLRMYVRWAERSGFEVEEIDLREGDEAGVRDVTLLIKGDYAYGKLRSEHGVHRLVRISPFDSNARRHTSFASLAITPEIDDSITIEIDEKDLRIDIFCSGGKGGQNVNKVSTAVRMTHLPTGIVVQCQNERSQLQNRTVAMKMLRARLYQRAVEERQAKRDAMNAAKSDIAFGHQIRSYVLHPYNLVKDLRTDVETSDTVGVLDGKIDIFIESYLRQSMGATVASRE